MMHRLWARCIRGRVKISEHPYERVPIAIVTCSGYAGRRVMLAVMQARGDVDVAEAQGPTFAHLVRLAGAAASQPLRKGSDPVAADRGFRLLLLNLLWPAPRSGRAKPRLLALFCSAGADWVDLYFRLWKTQAKVIQIVDNGITHVAASSAHVFRLERTFLHHCSEWCANLSLAKWLKANPAFLWLREEDLLGEGPVADALARMFSFLDLPGDSKTADWLNQVSFDASNFALEPMTAKVWVAHWRNSWQSWDPARRDLLTRTCGDGMAYFGYALPWNASNLAPAASPVSVPHTTCGERMLVVAHFKENLSWIETLPSTVPVSVYSMTDRRYRLVENDRAYEVPCYLQYIIDHYSDLPRKIIFSQGHRTSWHQDFPMDVMATYLNWEAHDYLNLSRESNYSFISPERQKDPPIYQWLADSWPSLFGEYLPLPRRIFCYVSAQFLVDRECIRRLPCSFWEHCYRWLENTKLPATVTARLFEYVWAYLFTGNAMEPRRQYREIFHVCSQHFKEPVACDRR